MGAESERLRVLVDDGPVSSLQSGLAYCRCTIIRRAKDQAYCELGVVSPGSKARKEDCTVLTIVCSDEIAHSSVLFSPIWLTTSQRLDFKK